ncbi:MAG: hypothetical protein V4655_01085 [Bdellovibrionota bacterium]|nr:MAG: hypothetical protein EOP10_17885 [Pseudomonadota bacterium]
MKQVANLAMILGLFLSPLAFGQSQGGTAGGEKVNQGLENVKEGTRQTAEGISTAAAEAGKEASAAGAKVGRALKAATCPVVGDRKTKLYYAKDSKSYAKVLDGQKYFEDDDRSCFMTEQAARDEGYTRNAN